MRMSRWITTAMVLCFGLVATGTDVSALSGETELLLKLLEKKGVVSTEEAASLAREVGAAKPVEDTAAGEDQGGTWVDRITLSGVMEVEGMFESVDSADASVQDTDASDIALAKVQLAVDADIAKHVKGHAVFEWGGDPLDMDEGFIILDGEDVVPLYMNAGLLYVPFGYFESHFISNPMTKEIGETRQGAVKLGYTNDWLELSAAFFNADVDEVGDSDNRVDGFAAAATFTLPEGVVPDLGLTVGISYLSSIADTDGLEGETSGLVTDTVGGFSAFISASLMDKAFIEAEYLGAMDGIAAGDMSFDGGDDASPKAWNLELGYAVTEDVEVAIRYEGSDDLDNFQPESQYGLVVNYGIFEGTALLVEYLHGELENDDARDLLTTQLAIEF